MNENMKPCPFCGRAEIAVKQSYDQALDGMLFQAVCVKCGCRSGHHDTIPAVASQWNTRAPDPRVERLVEALQGIVNASFTELREIVEKEPRERIQP